LERERPGQKVATQTNIASTAVSSCFRSRSITRRKYTFFLFTLQTEKNRGEKKIKGKEKN
jgi:hypothetical protein